MPTSPFTLIAGVEISQGSVATLDHGQVDTGHDYGDPAGAALDWLDQGAGWLHVADLDAELGTGTNTGAIAHVLARTHGAAHVQLAGGIRDAATLQAALHHRPARVVLDTAALADLDFVRSAIAAQPDHVAAGITAHRSALHAPGSAVHGAELTDVLAALEAAGCRTYVVTDVDAEGARKGSDRHVLEQVCARVDGEVIACGGIARTGDLHHLVEMAPDGVVGAVVDRPLYTSAFTFADALTAIAPRWDPYEWGPAQP
ncbi:MAG TPA: HisA/HisF-related TIM barrel protein [Candidatus Nanopelagicales bacterium]|nr:HisA/HisF-related TIM barrel protein [Candidatus Nanopelagicales bacterium]